MSDSIYIAHHGIKGMRWGERRWQNEDGSLTPEGFLRYYGKHSRAQNKLQAYSYKVGGNKTSIGRALMKRSEMHGNKAQKAGDEYSKKLGKKSFEVSDELIKSYAKANRLSIKDAKSRAKTAMDHYRKVEKSDVIKKYPHDAAKYGHPIQAGGYANSKLTNDIEAKSGSWYSGKAVKGSNFESAMKSYNRARSAFSKANAARHKNGNAYSWSGSQEKERAKKMVLDAVLKDLGFPSTQANRDAIEYSVFWD